MRGDVIARYPFSASISNIPDLSPVPTPLQVFLKTFRIEVFNRFPMREARLARRPIADSSPPLLLSIPLRINASSSLRPA
jgi:hypothetical protein